MNSNAPNAIRLNEPSGPTNTVTTMENTEGKLQMLLSPRKKHLESLFKGVRVFKAGNVCACDSKGVEPISSLISEDLFGIRSMLQVMRIKSAPILTSAEISSGIVCNYGQSSYGQSSALSAILPSAFSEFSAFSVLSCGSPPQ